MFDDQFSRIESQLGMKSIGNNKHVSTSNTNETMGGSTCEEISDVVTNAMMIDSPN